jgi:C4-dicarboxylate transporter, DctM subunit
MEPMTVAVFLILLLFLAAGVHIGVALGAAGLLGMFLVVGDTAAWAQLRTIPYNSSAVYTLAVVPMFIMMGSFFYRAGFTGDMYQAAYLWLGRLRGGLAIATTVGSAAFGAVTGSSVANAAMFSRVALPEMVRHGVAKSLAVGCIAASGTLASLIPPSLLLVIYGIITEQSVAALLVAGLLPGLLSMLVYIGGIYFRVVNKPELSPRLDLAVTWRERFRSIVPLWAAVAVFLLVMGGIYAGYFTPTQAGAVGAFAAFALGLIQRRYGFRGIWEGLRETGSTTATILLIIVGGAFFARFLGYSGFVRDISQTLLGLELPPFAYLLVFMVVVVVLGMFLEAFSIMVLVLPLMFPILVGAGYDPIWLGVITIKLVEIGLITPPVGLNVYVVKSSSPIPVTLGQVYQGVTPFLLLDVLTLAVLIAFPSIVLYLPNVMAG